MKNQNFDVVINLAAQAGVRYSLKHPDEYLKSNLIGFCNLINWIKLKNKAFLFASTSSVYGIDKSKTFKNSPAVFQFNIMQLQRDLMNLLLIHIAIYIKFHLQL